MGTVLVILAGVCYVVIVLLVALRIPHSQFSEFELARRKKLGDPQAVFGQRRAHAYRDIVTVRWLKAILLGYVVTICLHAAIPGWRGIVLIVVAILLVGPLARIGGIRRLTQRIYRHYESSIMRIMHRAKKVWKVLSPPFDAPGVSVAPSSRAELEYVIEHSETNISRDEIHLLQAALKFYEKTAESIMTLADDLVTVPVDEVVGPLVVNDLHKSGHMVFPVTNVAGEYVGLFDISRFTSLRTQESPSVKNVMMSEVVKVHSDEPLDEVLKIFVDTKQTYMFVIDEDDVVVGLISLSDIVRALTGWRRQTSEA